MKQKFLEQLKEFIDEINTYLKPSVSSQNNLFEKIFMGADLTKRIKIYQGYLIKIKLIALNRQC